MASTPDPRPRLRDATVVDVEGSRFLLEWLEWDTLAQAAAHWDERPREDRPERPAA